MINPEDKAPAGKPLNALPVSHKNNLKDFRTSLGLTQAEISRQLGGIKQARYSHYENNARDIPSEILILLAEKFNLNIHWLITGVGPRQLTGPEWNFVAETGAHYRPEAPPSPKYSAILFFSEYDRNLAKAFCSLSDILNEPVFCSSESPHSTGDEQYMESISSKIRQSACIVPIFSRHSLQRSLWFFEIGAAKGHGCKIFPGIVRGLSRLADGFQAPPLALNFEQYNKLYTKEGLLELFVEIIGNRRGDREAHRRRLEKDLAVLRPDIIQIIEEASARPIFIAGSPPADHNPETNPDTDITFPWKEWTKEQKPFKPRKDLPAFSERLTAELIHRRFNICTNPYVKMVGKTVYAKAESLIAHMEEDRRPDSFEFIPTLELGGIPSESFQILEESSSRTESTSSEKKQKDQIINIHSTYLKNKEWFIVIGGNQHTWQEFSSIQFFNQGDGPEIKVFAFPCFGGTAFSIYKHLPESARTICYECMENSEHLGSGCPYLKRIVDYLFNTYL